LTFLHNLTMEVINVINDPSKIGDGGLFNRSGQQVITIDRLKLFVDYLIQIFSFDKPIGDLGTPRDDTPQTDVFYNEREWRIIPYRGSVDNGTVLSKDGEFYLPFRADALRLIIVPSNTIRKQVVTYLSQLADREDPRLRSFAENVPPVLNYDDVIFF